MRLPPHNQRRLTAALKDRYGDTYCDCIEYLTELQTRGYTYAEIAEEVRQFGVTVSQFAIRDWMLAAQRDQAAA